ncbi:MAG: hypothetical protein Q7R62_01945 [bacterium]|nr:hypothetical protein [bacterium]
MTKLGPGAGAMEAGAEQMPLSELYTVDIREKDGVRECILHGPLRSELRAEISGDEDKTLRFTKLLPSGGGVNSNESALIMIKGMIIVAQNALQKTGSRLAHIEVPMGAHDLQHFFSIEGIGEIFGTDEIEAGKKLYNPRPEDTPKRRATDTRPGPIRLTLWDMTQQLKEYEEKHGEIRQ